MDLTNPSLIKRSLEPIMVFFYQITIDVTRDQKASRSSYLLLHAVVSRAHGCESEWKPELGTGSELTVLAGVGVGAAHSVLPVEDKTG